MTAAWNRRSPVSDEGRAFDAIYAAYRERVFRWALRYGGGKVQWAEDLTHDVFLKAFERMGKLRDTDDLGGWLYRVTANLAISRIRREQGIFSRIARLYAGGRDEVASPADATYFAKEEAAAVTAALQSLPARERIALCMLVLDGKKQREIAHDLGISEGYVTKLIQRAWVRLRAAGWDGSNE